MFKDGLYMFSQVSMIRTRKILISPSSTKTWRKRHDNFQLQVLTVTKSSLFSPVSKHTPSNISTNNSSNL